VPGDKLFFSVVGWHALTLPQDPKLLSEARTTMMALILASGIDPRRSIVFHQDEVRFASRRFSGFPLTRRIGPEPCRTRVDSELSDTGRKVEADDDVEGTWLFTHTSSTKHVYDSQTRLAVSRNANDESEIDDSLLNAGLFTYPVLQAADILAYR
jgi:tryptophanyl-tRNA synthetase